MNLSIAEYRARLVEISAGLYGVAYEVGDHDVHVRSLTDRWTSTPVSVTVGPINTKSQNQRGEEPILSILYSVMNVIGV